MTLNSLRIYLYLFIDFHLFLSANPCRNTGFFRSTHWIHVYLFPLVYSHILLLKLLRDYHYFILEFFNNFIICCYIPPVAFQQGLCPNVFFPHFHFILNKYFPIFFTPFYFYNLIFYCGLKPPSNSPFTTRQFFSPPFRFCAFS